MADAPGAEAVDEEVVEEERAAAPQPIFTGAHGVGARFAGRIGRHATAYGVAAVGTLISGLVSVAVFTRFLDPDEFGKMAVLSTVSTLITMVATLGIMQGTMRRIYGSTGDDEAGEVDAGDREAASDDPRRTLSTGLALTFVLGAVLFALAVALQGKVAGLFGGPGDGSLVVLAAGAGVAGAVMRFSRNILRLQLRSSAYLVVTVVYSFAGIPVAVPLLAEGAGVEAVLIGFIVASIAAAALCLLLLATELRPAVSPREAWEILTGGLRYLPIMLSMHVVQLGDTLLVASFGGFGDTGVYRVAQRIAMPVSFGTSVFQQAWGPMRRDMTQAAVEREEEEREARTYTARLFTYYAVFVAALIVGVAVFADQFVKVASGQFGEAAALVPLTALGVAGHGWFIFAYRNSRLPAQFVWMIGLSLLSAAGFIGFSFLLIPPLGAVGAPLAAIASWGIAATTMFVANQLIGKPIPFEYRNLLILVGTATLVVAVSRPLPDSPEGVVVRLLLLLAWAAVLFAAGIVPGAEVRAVGRLARDATGIDSARRLRARIAALDGTDALLVDGLIHRRRPPQEVAAEAGFSEEEEALAAAVHALRGTAGGGDARETDAELGRLLFTPMTRSERDMGLLAMAADGADPIDTDLVKRAAATARVERRSRSTAGRA